MHNLEDFHIEKQILPLFDFSLHKFTKKRILSLLYEPIASEEAILHRQQTLKAFQANLNLLEDYSYTVLYLNEVHEFLLNERIEDFYEKKWRYKWVVTKSIKSKLTGKFNQLVLLFHRLDLHYFSRLNVDVFPEEFQQKIKNIIMFLNQFKVCHYEKIIREKRLKDNDIIDLLHRLISIKQQSLITPFFEDFFEFEAYLSISYGIKKHQFNFPSISKEGIQLKEFYHPLISNPIKNNIETTRNVIVLNGPNMSGKSTLLKAISICVYLGHLGFGIPAKSGKIPLCEQFTFSFNKKDDLLAGYSHFMNEVKALKEIVIEASSQKPCFAVFDEMFNATNPNDAQVITLTTIHGLRKFSNSYFFISTHFQSIKNDIREGVDCFYMDFSLVNKCPEFPYHLEKGWSSVQIGKLLFDMEGLDKLLE